MNHSPRGMLSARYDRHHIPRIPVPVHDRCLFSFARSHRLNFETEPVTGHPGARDVEFLGAVATADHGTTSFRTEATGLGIHRRSVAEDRTGGECELRLTVSHRWGFITLMPSTNRNLVVSLKVSSGMNTEQSTCTHPCPSVGFCARKNVSAGG